ncbi:hypothetical protein CLCR_07630 [Cladophialophora carrionii]|uniref:Uncharacterized protein n=1 Tax=Cladophialophora carrionii TaxID=86049 RepID=A0A1C1CPA1_9EURO|nr:hypothetical protein CLCR_07630 [Cladophialophora carrionii]
MAPAHHSKKYAVASEKSSGTGNLNMRAGSLNPHLHQSPPQPSQQHAQMITARNNSKHSARHAQPHAHAQQLQQQQKQAPHPNLAQAVAPARHLNSSPAGDTGAGPGQVQGHGPGDRDHQLHCAQQRPQSLVLGYDPGPCFEWPTLPGPHLPAMILTCRA